MSLFHPPRSDRRYADPEYIWNLARTHGININRDYAEVFQVYRLIA